MEAFGVRFAVNDSDRFEALRSLYAEVKARFSWPTPQERAHWLGIRNSVVIAIPDPSQQLGAEWDFYRVFEAIEESEYDVLDCVLAEPGVGELRINPHSYPYGGVGPLIALAEGYGFTI